MTRLCRQDERTISGDGFTVEREAYSKFFCDFPPMSEKEFYTRAKSIFGQNCHIAGNHVGANRCILVMRSSRGDDHSKPQLEAMKEAAEQLSPQLPGFIALQYNDVSSNDLQLPHVKRRTAILAGYLFYRVGADHVAGVHISAFGAISAAADAKGPLGILLLNPNCRFWLSDPPFSEGLSSNDFECIVPDIPVEMSDQGGISRIRAEARHRHL